MKIRQPSSDAVAATFRLRSSAARDCNRSLQAAPKRDLKVAATSPATQRRSAANPAACRAFTMVEIAICLAIIGVALVSIIGVLPIGMRAQRDNREETIINQDATVFLEAVRNGAIGLDDLTNYVYAITNYWTVYPGLSTGVNGYTYAGSSTIPSFAITNGLRIVGLLSTPEYAATNTFDPLASIAAGGYVSNHIVAYVRSLSGPATEKPPQNNPIVVGDSFGYRILCVNAPVPTDTNAPSLYTTNLTACLRELRLTFLWPQLPNGTLGAGRQTFRTLVAGQIFMTNDNSQVLYFYQPQSFTNILNPL